MTYRAFELPEYHEFLDALGMAPEPSDDVEAQTLTFDLGDELIVVTLDVAGRSVHCHWSRGSQLVAEIFREGAVRLSFRPSGNCASLLIDFETDSERGQLEVQVSPTFAVRDRLLFR